MRQNGIDQQRARGIAVAAFLVASLSGCDLDRAVAPMPVSSLDGKPLDAKVMQSIRNSSQGCYFSIQAGMGAVRVLGLRGKHLPFQIPAITTDPITGKGDGRNIALTIRDPEIPVPIDVDCWVPARMTVNDLATAVASVEWERIYRRVRKARIVTSEELARPVSREMQQYQHESLQYPVSQLQMGPRVTHLRAGGQLASSPVVGSIAFDDPYVWTIECSGQWVDEVTAWYFICTITRAQVLGGVTVTARATPPASPQITTVPTAVGQIELESCGYLGCSGGTPPPSYGDPINLGIDAYFENNDSTVGQMVHFTALTDVEQLPQGTTIYWSWYSNDEDDTTHPDYTCDNNLNCSFRVYSEGRAEVAVQTPSGYAEAYKRIEFSVEPCTGPDPDLADLNALRMEYKNGYTMPPCSEFQYQPSGTLVSWEQIKDHGPTPHTHAIYKQSVDNGLVSLSQLATVVILATNHRIYTSPTYQYFINRTARNSRHIYGDAADMRAQTEADWNVIEAHARSLTPRPCREPWNPNRPHLHIDYRNEPGAIRQLAGPCPAGW